MNQPKACKSCGALTPGPYCQECEFMSPDQAAARMHISRSTYFRMVKEGKIHPRKIGAQKTLVSRQEIDNLLSGQQISDSPSQ